MSSITNSVLIIGGGITGLSVGWQFSKQGFSVTLLEKSSHIGGFAGSFYEGDYIMDIGPHFASFPNNSSIFNEIQTLMGNDELIEIDDVDQTSRVFFQNKVLPRFPNLSNVILKSGKIISLKILFELFLIKLKIIQKSSINTSEYLKSSFGKTLYALWFYPYLFNRFGNHEPPLDLIKSQFPELPLKNFLKLIKKTSIKPTIIETNYKNFYFKKGMGSLIKKITNEIKKNNGEIITNANITCIDHKTKNVTYLVNNINQNKQFQYIIYAIPLDKSLIWFENYNELKNKKIQIVYIL